MGTREGDTRTRVSPSRALVLSCAHYFQAPATQAISGMIFAAAQNYPVLCEHSLVELVSMK